MIRRVVLLVAVVAFALAGCGRIPRDPTKATLDALRNTVEAPFAFEVRLDVSGGALDEIAADDPQVAKALETLVVRGRVSEPGALFQVEVLDLPVAEFRQVDEELAFVRVDLEPFAQLAGEEFDVDEMLTEFGDLPPSFAQMGRELLSGEWVGWTLDPDELEDAFPFAAVGPDEAELRADFEEAFGDDPVAIAERYTDITETRVDGVRRMEVALRLRDLVTDGWAFLQDAMNGLFAPADMMLEASGTDFSEVPETVTGIALDVDDRVVHRVTVDILQLARTGGAEDVPEGSFAIVVEITEHGSAPAVEAPEGVEPVDLVELIEEARRGWGFQPAA